MSGNDLELKNLTGRKIFLSFRGRDEPQVFGLKTLLINLGNTVTKMGEFPAGRWSPHIYKSLAESDTLLMYISRGPEQTAWRKAYDAVKTVLQTLWKSIMRRPERPADWMKEEYDYFKEAHGEDAEIIVYAEEDAVKPDYLRDQQFHFYVSQLTEVRQKWAQLKKDGVDQAQARQIIIEDLKSYGVDLDERAASQMLDLFGVQGINSAGRYIWARSRGAMAVLPFLAGIALAGVLGYGAGQEFGEPTKFVPNQNQVVIELDQNGRMACANKGLVCASVSQKRVRTGSRDDRKFYGYATPTCESRLKKSQRCVRTLGKEFELTDIYFTESKKNESGKTLPKKGDRLCVGKPKVEFANCIEPLGE